MEFFNNNIFNENMAVELRTKFNSGKPYRHIFVEDFLNENKARELLEALKMAKFEYMESDLFSFSQTGDFANIGEGVLGNFYNVFAGEKLKGWVEKVCSVNLKGEIDMSGSLYKSCDYLLCHDDLVGDRKIAFIYYLSRDFHNGDGGSFLMFNSIEGKVGKESNKIIPKWNHLLLFEVSDISFHEVEEVLNDKERFAIGGWFK